MSRFLLKYTAPVEGESLYGYVARLGRINHYESFKDILGVAGPPCDSNDPQKIIRALHSSGDAQERLAVVAKQQPSDVKRLAYTPIEGGSHRIVQFGKSAVQADVLAVGHLRVCPQCIEEGIHRQLWDVSLYIACHYHGWLLRARCHDCDQIFNLNTDFKTPCSNCGCDPARSRVRASDGEIALAAEIARLAEIERGADGSPDSLPLVQFMSSAQMLIRLLAPTEKKWPVYQLIEKLPLGVPEVIWQFLQSEKSFRQAVADYLASRKAVAPALSDVQLMSKINETMDRAGQVVLSNWFKRCGCLPEGRATALFQQLARDELISAERAGKILGVDRIRLLCLARQFIELRTHPNERRVTAFTLVRVNAFMSMLYEKVEPQAPPYPVQALGSLAPSAFRKDGLIHTVVELVLAGKLPLHRIPGPGRWGMQELFVPTIPIVMRDVLEAQVASRKGEGNRPLLRRRRHAVWGCRSDRLPAGQGQPDNRC